MKLCNSCTSYIYDISQMDNGTSSKNCQDCLNLNNSTTNRKVQTRQAKSESEPLKRIVRLKLPKLSAEKIREIREQIKENGYKIDDANPLHQLLKRAYQANIDKMLPTEANLIFDNTYVLDDVIKHITQKKKFTWLDPDNSHEEMCVVAAFALYKWDKSDTPTPPLIRANTALSTIQVRND